jgi:hypothetical protein
MEEAGKRKEGPLFSLLTFALCLLVFFYFTAWKLALTPGKP